MEPLSIRRGKSRAINAENPTGEKGRGGIGFDDMPVAALSNPTLTTVRINSDAIGMIAADLLLSRIQNQKLPSRYTYVQTTPVFRESTGILHE